MRQPTRARRPPTGAGAFAPGRGFGQASAKKKNATVCTVAFAVTRGEKRVVRT